MRLLKKKVNVFGKGIPILAIFVLGIALVSAALVPYLSGLVIGTVTAESPMRMEISDDGSTWLIDGTLNFGTIHGGGVITFYTRETNLADKEIIGDTENIVTSAPVGEYGITCEDFESVIVSTKAEGDASYYWSDNVIGLCNHPDDADYVTFRFPNQDWDAGQVEINKIDVTFKLGAVGNYEFTSQIVVP